MGPTLAEQKKRINEREIEAAMQCGVDMLAYGVALNNGEDSTNVVTTDDGCQLPTKKRRGTKDTFKLLKRFSHHKSTLLDKC